MSEEEEEEVGRLKVEVEWVSSVGVWRGEGEVIEEARREGEGKRLALCSSSLISCYKAPSTALLRTELANKGNQKRGAHLSTPDPLPDPLVLLLPSSYRLSQSLQSRSRLLPKLLSIAITPSRSSSTSRTSLDLGEFLDSCFELRLLSEDLLTEVTCSDELLLLHLDQVLELQVKGGSMG